MTGATAGSGGVPVYVVDAFTTRAFGGNPAGVCLLDRPMSEAWMAAVAAEMRHSETAFVDRSEAPFRLRWFTPAVEVALCGHATLAAAHVCIETGIAGAEVDFATRSGPIAARRDGARIALDLPADPASPAAPPPGLVTALGVPPTWVGRSTEDLAVEVADATTLERLAPDLAALATMAPRGVIVSAPGEGAHDVVVRFFAPALGVPEDPVTGSAQCAIAHRWASRLGRDRITVRQASARGGLLDVRPAAGVVEVAGSAVTVLVGRLVAAG